MRSAQWAIGLGSAIAANAAFAADIPVKVVAAPPPAAAVWELTINSEARYYSWHSTRGFPTTPTLVPQTGAPARGTQVYVPFAFQLVGRPVDDFKVELLARSGYVSARQSIGAVSGEAAGALDSVLSSTVTYLGVPGVQPFASFNLNLPTGKTLLPGSNALARGDADLVDIPAFGEGLNVGGTLGLNVPVTTSLVVTASAGFTDRGAFDREAFFTPGIGAAGMTRLDPGDVLTLYGGFGWRIGALTIQGSGTFTTETETTYDGRPAYRSGSRYTATGVLAYVLTETLSSTVTASFSHYEKNDVRRPFPPPLDVPLAREAFNSNSNVTKVNFDATYKSGAFELGPLASFLYRDRNGWDPTTFQFVPAKTTWSAGGSARYAITREVTLTARAEHRWTRENESPDKIFAPFVTPVPGSGVPIVDSRGWTVSLGAIARL
jgi:hypothetical protein